MSDRVSAREWSASAGGHYAPKLGFEYNWASRYAISFAQPTDLLTNKLATRGSAYEAYAIEPIGERAFCASTSSTSPPTTPAARPGNIAGATGFFGIPDNQANPAFAHGGTWPTVNPTGQHLTAISMTLHTTF